MLTHLLTCLALSLPAAPQETQAPKGADQLIEQAWGYLPAYGGAQRELLSAQMERQTRAGAHLLEAGLALNPEHIRGLWSLGHARFLLAENHRHRGQDERAKEERGAAISALERALQLDPKDPWCAYALAMAHTSGGAHRLALAQLERALTNAEAAIAQGQDQSTMRFKSLEWLPEVQMRAGMYAASRESLRRFHGEFSSNSWPLLIALAESFQRERDFAGARQTYAQIIEEYPNDFQAYALLGYLEGLTGQAQAAAQGMRQAIRYERFAGLYTRIWLWLMATPELEQPALADLRAFLKNPPDSVSAWDRTLGRFLIGELSFEDFERAADDEIARRLEAAEALDSLASEVAFYTGRRHEREAQEAADEGARSSHLSAALHAYRQALQARPIKWKWEWAHARMGLARVAGALGISAMAPPALGAGQARRWHRAGSEQPSPGEAPSWRAGDLVIDLPAATEQEAGPRLLVLGAR